MSYLSPTFVLNSWIACQQVPYYRQSLDRDELGKLERLKMTYQESTKQYFKVGSLLQYIPGTNANTARKQFCSALKVVADKTIQVIDRSNNLLRDQNKKFSKNIFFERHAHKQALKGSIVFSSFLRWMQKYVDLFPTSFFHINRQQPFKNMLVNKFPYIRDICEPYKSGRGIIKKETKLVRAGNSISNFCYALFNPFHPLGDGVRFTLAMFNRITEVASDKNSVTHPGRKLPKFLILFTQGCVLIPITILEDIWGVVLKSMSLILLKLPAGVLKTCYQQLRDVKTGLVFATVEEFTEARDFRRHAKPISPHSSYKTIYAQTQYVSHDKHLIHNSHREDVDHELAVFKMTRQRARRFNLFLALMRKPNIKEEAQVQAQTIFYPSK